MSDPNKTADKTHVVIQDGRRVSGPLNEQEAKQEAERRNRLLETQGKPTSGKAQVKQNLLG